jgi:hypothetical protein
VDSDFSRRHQNCPTFLFNYLNLSPFGHKSLVGFKKRTLNFENKEKKMKIIIHTFTALAIVFSGVAAFAEETTSEKVNANANDAKRAVKKGVHRAQEAVCMENDAKCLARKAKNRGTEAKDYVKDKANETKEAVDSN